MGIWMLTQNYGLEERGSSTRTDPLEDTMRYWHLLVNSAMNIPCPKLEVLACSWDEIDSLRVYQTLLCNCVVIKVAFG